MKYLHDLFKDIINLSKKTLPTVMNINYYTKTYISVQNQVNKTSYDNDIQNFSQRVKLKACFKPTKLLNKTELMETYVLKTQLINSGHERKHNQHIYIHHSKQKRITKKKL